MSYDWSKIVLSHTDIVKRNDDRLFKFYEDNITKPYISWTPLENFEPDTISGPWQVSPDDIFAERFLINYEAKKFEQFFLAGPMVRTGRRAALVPLFYKEINLKKNGALLDLSPQSSKWSITPEFYKYIDEIFPIGDSRKMVDELFEVANVQLKNNLSLSAALYEEILSLAVDTSFEQYVELSGFDSVNANWLIFATKDNFGKFDVNLGRDYVSMKKSLEKNPKKIGGLSVLEKGGKKKTYKDDPVFEVVDLDESQRKCVQALMSDRPLTVITGPPGTGKSQVVVSTLLNTWANKKTALFVSNNNQAVEVVRQRLEEYREDMPMFVRTGARQHNNQSETLNEIMDIIADYEPDKNRIKKLEEKDVSISESIKSIEKQLNTGEPEKITEAYKSALRSYTATDLLLEDIDKIKNEIDERVSIYGAYGTEEELEAAIAVTEKLHLSGLEKKKVFDEKIKEAETYEISLNSALNLRQQYAKDIGIESDAATNWDALTEFPHNEYEQSYKECRDQAKTLADIPAPDEKEWNEIYNNWEKPRDAEDAKISTEKILEILEEQSEEISRVFELDRDLKANKAESLIRCKDYGYEEGAETQASIYQNWIANWKTYLNSPKSDLDDIPIIKIFTKRATALSELEKIETVLFQTFSVNKVNQLQPISDDVRKHFSEEVEMLFNDAIINEKLSSNKLDLEAMQSSITVLNDLADSCSLLKISGDLDSKSLKSFKDSANAHSELCQRGIEVIEKNNKWIIQKKRVKQAVEKLLSINQGSWIIRSWKNYSGSICYQILDEIRQNPSVQNNEKLLDEIYKGTFDNLLENWKNIEKINHEIDNLNLSIKEINANAIYDEWIIESSNLISDALKINLKENSFDDLESIEYSIRDAKKILEDWNRFDNEIRPNLSEEYSYEVKRSFDELESAIELIPENTSNISEHILSEIRSNPESKWPLGELSELFSNYNSEALNNKLEAQKRLLNENEFHRIKELWLSEITKDESVSDAIESIMQIGDKAIDDQGDKFAKVFEKVIKVMPIWISTAQSLKSVPMIAGLFDLVIIDEASQCTTTNILPVIFRGKRVGMIGDPHQLSPIYSLNSREEEDDIIVNQGMDKDDYPDTLRHYGTDAWRSSWSSLPRSDKNTFRLKSHYRSDPQIIGFSNANIYRRGLQISKKSDENLNKDFQTGVHMIQVSGSSERDNSRSLYNHPEANAVVEKAIELHKQFPNLDIGVVTPYRRQKELIKQNLEIAGIMENILCGTADTFQGDERDIMIFSPVISKGSEPGSRDWVEKPHNRVNVAVTRARRSLYVIGDIQFCATHCTGILQKLANYCRDINKLRESNSNGELELHKLLTLNGYNPNIHPIISDMEVDFLIKTENGERLVVEVDGQQHDQQKGNDESRDATLRAQGYEVCRLDSRDIFDRPIDVLDRIEGLLE